LIDEVTVMFSYSCHSELDIKLLYIFFTVYKRILRGFRVPLWYQRLWSYDRMAL